MHEQGFDAPSKREGGVMTIDHGRRWAFRAGAADWSSDTVRRSAVGFHRSLPGYRPTPLRPATGLAEVLGVGRCWVKDESDRLGLPAFKVLGASWAVNAALSERSGEAPAGTLATLRSRLRGQRPTLVTATDGNHGRAIAWMARLLQIPARVYLPTWVTPAAEQAIRTEGAETILTARTYDEAVALAAASCAGTTNQVLVQDTSWPGYTEIPRRIVDGYHTLFAEIDNQLQESAPTLLVVPTGVGSLLQAALEHYRSPGRVDRPAVLAVEPVTADCVTRSLAAGDMVTVDSSAPTIMAGLNCGTVSAIAWPVIRGGLDAAVTITDDDARAAMADLARAGAPAGPCGAAALAGARAVTDDQSRREQLRLGQDAVVVLLSTEGVTATPIVSPRDA
jgi:diaminopropionate ammonia-lyase